jgi:hypothetical protein
MSKTFHPKKTRLRPTNCPILPSNREESRLGQIKYVRIQSIKSTYLGQHPPEARRIYLDYTAAAAPRLQRRLGKEGKKTWACKSLVEPVDQTGISQTWRNSPSVPGAGASPDPIGGPIALFPEPVRRVRMPEPALIPPEAPFPSSLRASVPPCLVQDLRR